MSDATAAMNDATSGERVRNQQRHRLPEQRRAAIGSQPSPGHMPRALRSARGRARASYHYAGLIARAEGRKHRTRAPTIAPRHRDAKHQKWGGGSWWRGRRPTSPCPICSWPWRRSSAGKSFFAHAARGTQTWSIRKRTSTIDDGHPRRCTAPAKRRSADAHCDFGMTAAVVRARFRDRFPTKEKFAAALGIV
jgi:hypothetical protein